MLVYLGWAWIKQVELTLASPLPVGFCPRKFLEPVSKDFIYLFFSQYYIIGFQLLYIGPCSMKIACKNC
jgi:hypothetical protein